jgi:hypothetical protein
MALRVTQAPLEVLSEGTTPLLRATQAAVEVLSEGTTPLLRVTQIAVEVLWGGPLGAPLPDFIFPSRWISSKGRVRR